MTATAATSAAATARTIRVLLVFALTGGAFHLPADKAGFAEPTVCKCYRRHRARRCVSRTPGGGAVGAGPRPVLTGFAQGPFVALSLDRGVQVSPPQTLSPSHAPNGAPRPPRNDFALAPQAA